MMDMRNGVGKIQPLDALAHGGAYFPWWYPFLHSARYPEFAQREGQLQATEH